MDKGVDKMKKAALIALVGISAVLLADCIVGYPTLAPPAVRAEVIITSPGPGYVWIAGYWGWRMGGYYWVPGRWTRAPRGRSWVDGRWERQGRRWIWRRGRWR